MYAVPTAAGTATVACVGMAAPAMAATCDEQAATLRLRRADPVPVQPAPGYARAVERIFRTLNRARSSTLEALASAATRGEQSRIAGRLAGAYAAAAADLRTAPDRRFVADQTDAIAAALAAAAKAYRAMAQAAGRGDESGYAAARTAAVAAERRVGRAVRGLEAAGYRVP